MIYPKYLRPHVRMNKLAGSKVFSISSGKEGFYCKNHFGGSFM